MTMVFTGSGLAKGGKPEPPPTGLPYSGYSVMCGMLDPGVYTENSKYAFLRDAVVVYHNVTDSPYTTGWETLVMNYDLRLKSGKGISWGSLVFEPDAFSGNFTEDWTATAKHFVFDISGVYLGNGDLEGVRVTYELTSREINTVPADACGGGPIFDAQDISGYIILP
jgi:hypothetical protein